MATILNGDIQVDYLLDNRQKRLSWLGGTNETYTMNELYSAMATLLDETTTIDDGTCFSAETPVEYTIGKIDTGDTEPWYITFDLMEHITGGALRTSGWLRAEGTNTGVIVVPVTSGGAIVPADVGNDIVMDTDGDTGTLLEVIDTGGAVDYLVVRPDSSAAANSFDNAPTAGDTMTCNSNQSTQSSASTTGEQIWANLYSLGTIDSNVHLYMYQGEAADDADRTRVFSWNDNTQDWYDNGHIDTCVALKDVTSATWAIVDSGYITVFGRKYGDLYASFEVACSTTSGGRNPIPLQTAADLDNPTGIKKELTGAWSTAYIDGEIVSGGTSGARGIVDLSESSDGVHLVYTPIDDPQVDFSSGETITGLDSSCTSTSSGTPTDHGPADNTWFLTNTTPTVAFTHQLADIDDDSTNESYAITINCQANPLTEVYEWSKYATRNGEVTTNLDGINGERYIGGEVYLAWSGAISGTIAEGDDVSQTQTGGVATGVVVALDDTEDVMLLRDTRGTFNTTDSVIGEQAGSFTPTTATAFAPKAAAPLGTFAGGTFFGARGVLLTNYLSADENSFILTPIEGGTKQRPASINMEVSNLSGGAATSALHDRVAVFRLTGAGADIDKTEYSCSGGESAGANTITVGAGIAQDVPGKGDGGTLVIVDDDDNGKEFKLRFASWTGSVFTLNEITGTATAGTDATTLINSGATFTDGADKVYRGDLVYVSGKGYAYVETVVSNTELTLVGAGIATFADTDTYEINVPPVAITSSDKLYVPFMDRVATAAVETVSVIYNSTIFYRAKVRNTRAATKIKPFSVDGSTSGTDVAVATIRTTDTIIS